MLIQMIFQFTLIEQIMLNPFDESLNSSENICFMLI